MKKENAIKVLLVDDQAMVAEGIRRMLEDEQDIILHYCEDPARAIDTATEIEPNVILQDLVMPDIDGMTLVRFYRASDATKDVPIIVLSSKEDPVVKSEAFHHGASDYLVKLPDKIELIARIRMHSRQYMMQIERDAAYFALREMQKQLEQSNQELQRLSSLDGLTGIPNRRVFDETIRTEWTRGLRDHSEISLILIDIDHFKLFNDNYGHQGGDDCLKQVATILDKTATRSADVVARYGGEEFGVILPMTEHKGAMTLAEKMRQAVAELGILHEGSSTAEHVTISMGVATMIPGPESSIEQFIEMADKALYQAKERGRNQIAFTEN